MFLVFLESERDCVGYSCGMKKRQKFYCCNIEFKKSFRNRKWHKENDVETV